MHFVIFPIHLIFMRKSPYYKDWCEKQRDFNYDWQISEFFFVILRKREALWYREFLKTYHY